MISPPIPPGRIVAVSLSHRKGEVKHNVPAARLLVEHGLEGDAHAEGGCRQVSLLSLASIQKMVARGAAVGPGDFAENLTVDGLEVMSLPVGTLLRVGPKALLEITQIGKACHRGCAIREQVGDCVMPREGVFARVSQEGLVKPGDLIAVVNPRFRVGILTVSDKGHAGERHDASGPELARLLPAADFQVAATAVVPDELEAITAQLLAWCDRERLDLILTTGGTGLSPRDLTPEATLAVAQRQVPGLPEAMRAAGLAQTPHAMLSRGVAVLRGCTLIVNLPGSPRGARENLAAILPALPHALEKLGGSTAECGAP